MNTPIFQP